MNFVRLKWLNAALGIMTLSAVSPSPVFALRDLSFQTRDEDMRIIGRDSRDQAGSAVAVGDISGDGIGDILIGAPQSDGPDNTRSNAGEVAVVLGATALTSTVPIKNAAHTFFGATTSANLGSAVAVGDLDGDGVGDIIMGAGKADSPGTGGAGAVYVFYGGSRLSNDKTTDLATIRADIILYGAEAGGRLGVNLAVGDFNGDGTQDLAIAAPQEGRRFDQNQSGVVYVFFGQPGLSRGLEVYPGISGIGAVIIGPGPSTFAGRALAAGDVNGDGIDDLLIGTTENASAARPDSGEVHVVFGGTSITPGAVIHLADPAERGIAFLGPQGGDGFGRGLGTGDINGDGVADILIGAPSSEFVRGVATGRAYAIFGRPFEAGTTIDLATESADVTVVGPQDGAELGASLCAGDMDNDGIDEWIIGAPGTDRAGETYRIPGRTVWSELGVSASLTQGMRPGDRSGAVTVMGDVDGDGIRDLVVSSPLFDGLLSDTRDAGAVYVVRGKAESDSPSAECVDADGDGFRAQGRTCGPADCNDQDPAVHPGAVEICDDGIDNNCDGRIDGLGVDNDGDGWPGDADPSCGLIDCNDSDPAIHPGAPEICTDGKDNNCDGLVDAADPQCSPSPEVCTNCIDDDNNGVTDLFEPTCQANPLAISAVTARLGSAHSSTVRSMTIKGALSDAPFFRDPRATEALIVGIGLQDGQQLCVGFGKGTRTKGSGVIWRSTTRPRTTLRLRARKNGVVEFSLELRSPLALPAGSSPTLAVGIYPSDMPFRGSVQLQAKGRTLVSGN
jgi:putative metal-binding protein/FG-GAP repeat protein